MTAPAAPDGSGLSVARARELLGPDAPESDADVEKLVKLVYLLADSVLDSLTPTPPE